jgi:DNA-binding response OmpR family regulator
LKGALYSIGFRAIAETASFIKLHDLIEQDAIDLLVTSSELEDNDVGFLISEMRNHRLGSNPFLVVITLLANAEPEYVKRVIDSGCDDLLLTPVQPDQLILRIQKLTRTRKPFVVTHDYTGPDRRTKARSFAQQSAPLLEVPNPLKVRAETSGLDSTRLNRMIAEGAVTMNRLKIERYAVQIEWLVTHIHASIRDGVGATAEALPPHTSKLVVVASDMIKRLEGTPAASHIAPVAELLLTAKRLDEDPAQVPFAEMERLNTLAKIIARSLAAAPNTRSNPCAPEPAGMQMSMAVACPT